MSFESAWRKVATDCFASSISRFTGSPTECGEDGFPHKSRTDTRYSFMEADNPVVAAWSK